jgi:hypothetical protein
VKVLPSYATTACLRDVLGGIPDAEDVLWSSETTNTKKSTDEPPELAIISFTFESVKVTLNSSTAKASPLGPITP